jgi:hypothetical protein
MKHLTILVGLLVIVATCSAQTWVEVKGSEFVVPPDALAEIKTTLKDHVILTGDGKGYLFQYRATTIKGLRTLEIHGSCQFDDKKFDTRSSFYDEEISDGGECYFLVYFVLKTKRYSNVVFHGVA